MATTRSPRGQLRVCALVTGAVQAWIAASLSGPCRACSRESGALQRRFATAVVVALCFQPQIEVHSGVARSGHALPPATLGIAEFQRSTPPYPHDQLLICPPPRSGGRASSHAGVSWTSIDVRSLDLPLERADASHSVEATGRRHQTLRRRNQGPTTAGPHREIGQHTLDLDA